jgi:hypothetical protein
MSLLADGAASRETMTGKSAHYVEQNSVSNDNRAEMLGFDPTEEEQKPSGRPME